MSVWRLIFGILWLALSAANIFGRNRIQARQARRSGGPGQSPMLFVVLGVMFVLIGVCWVVLAFLA